MHVTDADVPTTPPYREVYWQAEGVRTMDCDEAEGCYPDAPDGFFR